MESDNAQEEMEVDFPEGKENGRKLTRGEKSRIAAKGRRDKEMVAMETLMEELPVTKEVLNKMDKTSIIRLAISYIKMKHYVQKDMVMNGNKRLTECTPVLQPKQPINTGFTREDEGQMMLEGLNGFLMFVNRKGSIRFVSNTIKFHLGLEQEYLIGKNITSIVHASDQSELLKQFSTTGTPTMALEDGSHGPGSCDPSPQKVFYLRMKYNLPKPGTKAKQSGYMLVQWTGKLKKHMSTKTGTMVTDGLLCVCRPMQTTPLVEIRMDGNMFMSRHDLGMTFTFCDTRIITLIGYEPNEVVGKTAYHFHNPIDAPKVSDCHQNLIVKGTSVSKYYRFLGKTDNWVWLQTRATIIYNTNNKPQYIVCMNYVISEEEGERYLMLEEHKHANSSTCTNNVILTLPDNHASVPLPSHIDVIKHVDNSGPQIVELCEENLKQTACLNGELDRPATQNIVTMAPPMCDNMTVPSIGNTVHQGYLQTDITPPIQGVTPPIQDINSINRYSETSEQILSLQSDIHCLNTAVQPQPVCDDITQGTALLQTSIPQTNIISASSDVGTCGQYNIDLLQDSPASCSSSLSYQESPPTVRRADQYNVSTPDNNVGYQGNQCHSNQSYSEDGGYESATSPYSSSFYSPQIVSPYSCDSGSERGGYTQDTAMGTGLIQGTNCNLGSTYSAETSSVASPSDADALQGDNSNVMFGPNRASTVPEAENIIDELLKSFNEQSATNNLDTAMAAVYSTMENMLNPNSPPMSTNSVIGQSSNIPKHKPNIPKPVNKMADKPLLRSFLTMPEDDIPKQPLTFLKACNKMHNILSKRTNGSLPGNRVRTNNIKSQTVPQASQVKNTVVKGTSSNTYQYEAGCPSSRLQPETEVDLDLCEMPQDISDFALQYLDSITDAQAQAVIADLNSDTFMDTSENDMNLTKDFLSSLENHCPNSSNEQFRSPANQVYDNSGPMFSPGSSMANCSRQNGLHGKQPNQPHSGNRSHDQFSVQSNVQIRPRSQAAVSTYPYTATPCSSGTVGPTYCTSQTQTPMMSQLESRLRAAADGQRSGVNFQTPTSTTSPRPFLQQLLTGELSKDSYMQMERERCLYNQISKPH